MGGQEEIRALFRIKPATKIIVASGLGTADQSAALRELPANHFLSKPFTIDALLQAVHLALTEPSAN
jgi:DNA-binding NarL/FixJ family response regulator